MNHWPYLPFLLIWAPPVIVVQWLVGARYLWRERRRWPWIVLSLGAYFTLADAVAILAGIWRFERRSLVGLFLGPVPIEEVLFYLLTAAMVVQGFVIAWGVWPERRALVARWRARAARLRRRPASKENTLPRPQPRPADSRAGRSPDV
ncbi:MAG: lycopene cyclase domain-containing protein [Ktedonobacterales bacterium]|nr:lycopene cyclase domain-containing protein [Ktedonobacterales bacterium]